MVSESATARYFIGIDLGTTNSALSYIDTYDADAKLQTLAILQWDDEQSTIRQMTLPSFIYIPSKAEQRRQQFRLPIHSEVDDPAALKPVLGKFAREQMIKQSGRVIHSSKSWLCHGGVDRNQNILPWHSDELIGEKRYSPKAAAGLILEHFRLCWDHYMAKDDEEAQFIRQSLIITVPASFDEAAQRLTLEAAASVGYPSHTRLLEEPQAAFYSWLAEQKLSALNKQLPELLQSESPSTKVLVCDIGGGTTDFSLLSIHRDGSPDSKELKIYRERVSNHILLGGDNIDLAIAHKLESKSTQATKLRGSRWATLIAEARQLKERCLSSSNDSNETTYYVSLAGQEHSSQLFSNQETIAIERQEIEAIVFDGFFPEKDLATNSLEESTQAGLGEWGLPYARDSRITAHLYQFLRGEQPDAVIFVGGSLNPQRIRSRLLSVIEHYCGKRPIVLESSDPNLAIAKGAAAFIWLKQSQDTQLTETSARHLFLEVENNKNRTLLCLIPQGQAVGFQLHLRELDLQAFVNRQVVFRLFYSSSKQDHFEAGKLYQFSEVKDLQRLPPLQQVLSHPSKKPALIRVELQLALLDTGLFQLFCINQDDPEQRWELDFDLSAQDRDFDTEGASSAGGHELQSGLLEQIRLAIKFFYGKKLAPADQEKARKLVSQPSKLLGFFEETLGASRDSWSLHILRQIWDELEIGMNRRNRSVDHEASWLLLSGYCLRPGFGADRDPDRMQKVWSLFQHGPEFSKEARVQDQWWIFWRRIAAGFDSELQNVIFDKIFPQVKKGRGRDVSQEVFLLAASLERASMNKRIQLGNTIVAQLTSGDKDYSDAKLWALARLCSRFSLHSGPETVVRPAFIEQWLENLSSLNAQQKHYQRLKYVLVQAARITGEREIDIHPKLRQHCLDILAKLAIEDELVDACKRYQKPTTEAYAKLFGEDLPLGLRLA